MSRVRCVVGSGAVLAGFLASVLGSGMATAAEKGPLVPPDDVVGPFIELLGVFKWLITVIGVTVLIASAGFLWADNSGSISSWLAVDPMVARRRVLKVLYGSIIVTTAGETAWWLLR
ncbi:MAG: hypothetical protein WAW85_11695 [Gordonia sp. (in: high G+C Gram-positive bacteria)]|uniref:hypothetical protein n=1 Tax=Gordonia sp. (in: high G+C Gram-positive bacteria) TaxID=84139 RepID=UPI003BB50665